MTGSEPPDAAGTTAAPPAPPAVALGRVSSRSDLIASTLREMIVAGRFEPGETLVERHLATMLGVSKTPVREALIALASTGLVEVSRNRGVVVRRPRAEDMWKVFELRVLLEPWAIGRATEVGRDAAVASAQVQFDESVRLLDADDRPGLRAANRRFHRALYSGCDNDLVVAQLDRLQDLVSVGLRLLWESSAWPVWRMEHEEHRAMLDAVRDGDADLATRRARDHIEGAMTLSRRLWRES